MNSQVKLLPVALLLFTASAFCQEVVLSSPTTVDAFDTTLVDPSNGSEVPLASAQIVVIGTTLTMNGRHSIASLSLESGAVLDHEAGVTTDYGSGGVVFGLELAAAATISIDASSSVDVTARGYAHGEGPGAGTWGTGCGSVPTQSSSGAGHGGAGGGSNGICFLGGSAYGDYEYPTTFGSGGGLNVGTHAGGGAVALQAGQEIVVEGGVRANGRGGVNGYAGGGAGGSVRLDAPLVSGAGTVEANGGDGKTATGAWPGSGAGGRVGITTGLLAFTGSITACGGTENNGGGAGTVFTKVAGVETLTVDNCGSAEGTTGYFPGGWTDATGLVSVDYLTVSGSARLSAPTLTPLHIHATGDVFVEAGAAITVAGRGYGLVPGPGKGLYHPDCGTFQNEPSAGGGAHGTTGAGHLCEGGPGEYGSASFPTTFGSEGGSCGQCTKRGYGGGAVQLDVGGTLIVDGLISADGATPVQGQYLAAGGGSGGSVLIAADSVTGSGSITANGGNGVKSAQFGTATGGTGGRIAIYSPDQGLSTNQITVDSGHAAGLVHGPQLGTVVLPQYTIGSSLALAAGCGGGALGIPELDVALTVLGLDMDVSLTAPGLGIALLTFGLQEIPLLPLDGIGMPGCALRHLIDLPIVLLEGDGTSASTSLELPDDPSLAGVRLYTTAFVADPSANPAGLILSNARMIVLDSGGAPPPASLLSPADGSVIDSLTALLVWSPAAGSVSYDLYLDIEPVFNAADLEGNFVTSLYFAGPLAPQTTYYWRVDSYGPFGGKTTGDVWSFTTP